MKHRLFCHQILTLFFLFFLPLCEGQVYKITTLPTLGGKATAKFPDIITGINSAGQATGCSPEADETSHTFLWTRGAGMQDLGVECGAGYINDLGHVAGWSPSVGAFLWTPSGGFQNLGDVTGVQGLNNLDQVTGVYYVDPSKVYLHAFLWTPQNPTLQDLGTIDGIESWGVGINDSTQVAGISAGYDQSWLWTESMGMQAIGGGDFAAYGINDLGQVIGQTDGVGHAAVWTQAGGVEDLGVLPGTTSSNARAINNRGVVVGNSRPFPHEGFVFLWSPTQGMVNVNTLCKNKGQNWAAVGINDAGQIAVEKAGGVALILTPIIGVAVSSSLSPSQVGQSVTFTATASSIAGAPPDSEIVTFKDSNTTLGTAPLVAGEASFSTTSLSAGAHHISDTYPGDTNYDSSVSKTFAQIVK